MFVKIKIWEIFTFRRRCSITCTPRDTYIYCSCVIFHNAVYKTVSRVTECLVWSQELLFCLAHCIVHYVKVMEELKMNRSEMFNFARQRCLYFTWCNNLFVNNSKVLQEISLHIPRYRTCEETESPRMIRFKSYGSNTVQIWWHVNINCVPHNISQFSLPVCCRFIFGKVRENVEALLSLFKYSVVSQAVKCLNISTHSCNKGFYNHNSYPE